MKSKASNPVPVAEAAVREWMNEAREWGAKVGAYGMPDQFGGFIAAEIRRHLAAQMTEPSATILREQIQTLREFQAAPQQRIAAHKAKYEPPAASTAPPAASAAPPWHFVVSVFLALALVALLGGFSWQGWLVGLLVAALISLHAQTAPQLPGRLLVRGRDYTTYLRAAYECRRLEKSIWQAQARLLQQQEQAQLCAQQVEITEQAVRAYFQLYAALGQSAAQKLSDR